MRIRPSSGFTLIEVITAMAVILILTGLVIQISSYVTNRGSKARATAEIAMLSTACESYKADAGAYPEDLGAEGVTNALKPKKDFRPNKSEYELASRFLYKELSGDTLGKGDFPDGIPDKDEPRYLKEFDPKLLKTTKDTGGKITEVKFIQDPFGYAYGYSTAAARDERKYLQDLKEKGSAARRPSAQDMDGFNAASFDLWSTGGSKPSDDPTSEKEKELEWAKWVKNW